MRALAVMLCMVLGGCGWFAKRGGGTNYDQDQRTLSGEDDRKRL